MRAFPVTVLLTVALAASGCGGGGDDGTGPVSPSTQSGLVGTWNATWAEYVSRTDSSLRVEVVSRGTTMVLSLQTSGYTLTITDPGEGPVVTTGTWSASTDVLTLQPAGVSYSIQFDMILAGNTLTLSGGHVAYDINGDGADEETTLGATLVRQ
jgi:hypothetical protein